MQRKDSTAHALGKKHVTETACENTQILDLTGKNFEVAIINVQRTK